MCTGVIVPVWNTALHNCGSGRLDVMFGRVVSRNYMRPCASCCTWNTCGSCELTFCETCHQGNTCEVIFRIYLHAGACVKKNIIMLECWMPCRLIPLVKADRAHGVQVMLRPLIRSQ